MINSLPHCSNYNIDTVVQQVHLKDQVQTFCEKSFLFRNCLHNCTSYQRKHKNSCSDPLFVTFTFNFADIEEGECCFIMLTVGLIRFLPANLIYLITKEPKQFVSIVEELICIFAQKIFTDAGSPLKILAEQIHCNIVLDLPLIPAFIFTWKTVHLNCALTTFRCIVYSSDETVQYMQVLCS